MGKRSPEAPGGEESGGGPEVALRPPVRLTIPWLDEGGVCPSYATSGAAGADLTAAIPHPVTLRPGQVTAVPTGVQLAIPDGFEGQIRARSGLAARHGVFVVNAPGTIDSDYRGEIRVLLSTLGEPYTINPGDRIAQIVFAPTLRAEFAAVRVLPSTPRGSGGFGHTGK